MVDPESAHKWAARFAAPVAFFAAVTVLVVLVQRGLDAGEANNPPTLTTPTATPPTTTKAASAKRKRRIYRVRRGDTLESIAAKFDTTVDDLIQLNPTIDPLALRPGQRIRVF
jgi:LysM repeat protein